MGQVYFGSKFWRFQDTAFGSAVKQYIMVAAYDKTFPSVVMTLRKMKRKGSGYGCAVS